MINCRWVFVCVCLGYYLWGEKAPCARVPVYHRHAYVCTLAALFSLWLCRLMFEPPAVIRDFFFSFFFSVSLRSIYETENLAFSPLGWIQRHLEASPVKTETISSDRLCLVLAAHVELAILLNLMIHYSSNGGPTPSGQRGYCIGSRVITKRLEYLLTLL